MPVPYLHVPSAGIVFELSSTRLEYACLVYVRKTWLTKATSGTRATASVLCCDRFMEYDVIFVAGFTTV